MSEPTRVLSGIQPTGEPHLGNYFGAMKQHLQLQREYPGECYFFIADYHALTTIHDANDLRKYVNNVAVSYLASGLDIDKACLFRQSDILEIPELTWMLSSVTGMGLLERAHSYKDKTAKGITPSMGLFLYPVLMAADILAYRSSLVPVGQDQIQHVEMTQDMATYFNQAFCPDAPVLRRPEYRLSPTPKVPGLDGEKMSKSYGNTIPIFAKGKQLKKLTAKIVTDSTPLGQPLNIKGCNVLNLLRLFVTPERLAEVEEYYRTGKRDGAAFGYGHAKQLLAAAIEEHFADAHKRREKLLANPSLVEDALQTSAHKARTLARETLDACRRACGLR